MDVALLGTSFLRNTASATSALDDIKQERLVRIEPRQRAVLAVEGDVHRVLRERHGLVGEGQVLVQACNSNKSYSFSNKK